MSYDKYLDQSNTPQSTPLRGKDMVQNNAGGYVFKTKVSDRLNRFLVLGITKSYYQSEQEVAIDNLDFLEAAIIANPMNVLNAVVEISTSGRAISNEPAIAAMAMLAAHKNPAVRREVLKNLKAVCRIPTHLISFIKCVKTQRGWGRGLRKAVSSWYTETPEDRLAYHLVKYRQREGFNHRDIFRLAHPKPHNDTQNNLFKYVVKTDKGEAVDIEVIKKLPQIIQGYEFSKTLSGKELIRNIKEYGLTWEMVPTTALNDPNVWAAFIETGMPVTAMLRNLGKMTSIGTLAAFSDSAKKVIETLRSVDAIKKSMVHPVTVFKALRTYQLGHGVKGSLTWKPVPKIVSALEDAFYTSFQNVVPSGKNIMIALDVSGSMSCGSVGDTGATPREMSALMAMVTMRSEPTWDVYGFSDTFMHIDINEKMSLPEVERKISGLRFGGTDASLPARYALENKLPVDAFVIYTDNETWAGDRHTCVAMNLFRKQMNRRAKLVVVAMTPTGHSVRDIDDPDSLDVVGFDTNAPRVISEFIAQ